ncbi:peptidase U32 family protein [Helicobacter cappadocius]|uniref:Peptidase U32 family protein n=1 Tax=Helicobacter cappadocius TaxID=3063998 RepID=A0AA90PPU5_9HELI|nr:MULTISPECIES: peptidase U32 family protein [unclassified Helicobacter]MDO7252629.1 peptidase U32 family protein [Helicobacter sp. faydin-H75]MDP2538496.1 peptidase U32 family protein [Helicobacter sp. faydin-H76]
MSHNSSKKVQLLSPAGNLTKLKIAIDYGADAVYGGVSHFSLRNRAGKDFNLESFKEGIDYAHSRGKKVFVTINGFPFNSQLKLLENHIAKMADLSPDAFIVAAPGVVRLSKKIAPTIPIHLSTQANVLNVLDAEVFYEMGVKRIVAARELSLKDAIEIKKYIPDLELEIFVHGSMCFAFSGRCLISALQNGRVPNRGSCANDCRFDYEYYVKNPDSGVMMRLEEEEGVGTHIFNSKDLNLASYVKEILDCGAIDALKIEGRTKSTYYAGLTARTYKMAIEDYYKGIYRPEFYQEELHTLKNRGFTDGYLIRRPHERLDTQNHFSAISEGSYQVNGEVGENGKYFLCKYTTKTGCPYEIVAPRNVEIKCIDNEIGKIYQENEKFYLILNKIILENNKELPEIHSGNVNPVLLPEILPPYTFLRTKTN